MGKHIVFVELTTTGAGEKAIEYAIKKNYKVTVLSKSPEKYASVTLLESTRVVKCDTNDIKVLLSTIKDIDSEQKIDGITTVADFYVPQAAKAAEALGLPSLSYEAALGVRNKYRMRCNLETHCPHLNPPFKLVFSTQEAVQTAKDFGYPLVAKPQNGNDSLNVKLICTERELIKYIEDSEKWVNNSVGQPYAKGVLLEGYIDGKEITVETLQHKGHEIKLIGVCDKILSGEEHGFFAEIGGSFPTHTQRSEILFHEVSNALEKLKIDCGVIHTECRVASDGQVKILEINPRLVGDMVGSHMIELALGASPIQQVVEIALGNTVPWQPSKQAGSALYGITMPRSGLFGGIENIEEIKSLPGVAFIKIMAEAGQYCSFPPRSNVDFIARLVTQAETPQLAMELAKLAAGKVKVLFN